MSKYINALINEVRESTENEDYDDSSGISEEEIVKFINQGQNRLHSRIVSSNTSIFVEEQIEVLVANQPSYTLDFKALIGNKVVSAEYSYDSNLINYSPLDLVSVHSRELGATGTPSAYFVRAGAVFLSPIPNTSTGSLRITYTRKLKSLDKRRGSVGAVTLNSGTSKVTNLEIDYVNGEAIDSTQLSKNTRFCVVDKYGTIKMENILLSSIDSSVSFDAKLSVDTSFTYKTGETIAIGDFIIPGEYASSHLELGQEVERYIQTFTEWKLLKRDSSIDSSEAIKELGELERDIIDLYAASSDDIVAIPQIGDWWE